MAKLERFRNQKVLYHGLESYLQKKAIPDIHKKLVDGVLPKMEKVIKEMVGSGEIPVYTGNLRNSIGVAIYRKYTLTKYTPIREDTVPGKPPMQSAGAAVAGVETWGIIGANLLRMAYDNPPQDVKSGFNNESLHLIVYAGVPYAWWVNDLGAAHSKEQFGKGHQWGNSETASGGRGQQFYSNLAGFRKLWNILGREFFRGNKPFIKDHSPIGL